MMVETGQILTGIRHPIITLKDHPRIGLTVGTSFLIFALALEEGCASQKTTPVEPSKTPTNTILVLSRTTNTEIPKSTPTTVKPKDTPVQIQKEQPKSIEQQAQEIVLRSWLNLWNSEQIGNNNFVNIKITNANIEDVINKKGILANSLNTKWVGGSMNFHSWEELFGGRKYTGEAQLDKIKINTSGNIPTSDADKANGLQWVGGVRIAYIIRFHAYNYMTKEWSSNFDATEKWLHSEETNAFPNFSPWEEEIISARLMLKNGKWEITQLDIPDSKTGGSPTLWGLKLPSKVLLEYGGQLFSRPCSYKDGSPCTTIVVDPQK